MYYFFLLFFSWAEDRDGERVPIVGLRRRNVLRKLGRLYQPEDVINLSILIHSFLLDIVFLNVVLIFCIDLFHNNLLKLVLYEEPKIFSYGYEHEAWKIHFNFQRKVLRWLLIYFYNLDISKWIIWTRQPPNMTHFE